MIAEEEKERAYFYVEDRFLDLRDGTVVWLFSDPESAGIDVDHYQELLETIKREPERFISIPWMSHGDHHHVLRKHLSTHGRFHEYDGSIGRWRKAYGDENYFEFEEAVREEASRRLRAFLDENGLGDVLSM